MPQPAGRPVLVAPDRPSLVVIRPFSRNASANSAVVAKDRPRKICPWWSRLNRPAQP